MRQLPRTSCLATAATAAGVVLVLFAGIAWWHFGREKPASTEVDPNRRSDPRVAYQGPFTNIRPGVQFVGDAECRRCHADKAESFAHHPMGNSITPLTAVKPLPEDAAHHMPFAALDSSFSILHEGGRTYHRRQKAGIGPSPYDFRLEALYRIGSGNNGHSYLAERDGFVFQTPISWYSQKKIWDLSPGFSEGNAAGRPVVEGCLFCHTNRVEQVAGTTNRYRSPVFAFGASIGCERCHGPGQLHAQSKKPDDIVDPSRLEPRLREAVCEQCHLEGESRVARAGRDPWDFRPGLSLSDYLAVFVNAEEGHEDKAVNHVEQMYASRCYKESGDERKLGCTSCHDPHKRVGPDDRIAYFKRRCAECHTAPKTECSQPIAERLKASPQDSCIQCHMTHYSSADIPHTASTDHRIPRMPRKPAPAAVSSPTGWPMAPVYRATSEPEVLEQDRDLGIALSRRAEAGKINLSTRSGAQVIGLLENALTRDREDWPSWHAKAVILRAGGRKAEALAAEETVLAKNPNQEESLVEAGGIATELGQIEVALGYFRRAVALSPYNAQYHRHLGDLNARAGEWQELLKTCDAWLALEPWSVSARVFRVTALLRTGRKDDARKEMDKIRDLKPANIADLNRWFEQESQ